MKKGIVVCVFLSLGIITNAQNEIEEYYQKNKGNTLASISKGTVSNGDLLNGKLVPFKGNNFMYFDTSSYLNGRAFINHKVLETMLNTYHELNKLYSERQFKIMECSNEH